MKSYTLAALLVCTVLVAGCGKGDEPRASTGTTPSQQSDKTATSGTFKPSAGKTY